MEETIAAGPKLHGNRRHGESHRTKEYEAWKHMIQRCESLTSEDFKNYGARGITVCDRWRKSFETFLADVGRAPSPIHTLGRLDNNGGYYPGNVCWQTRAEQGANTRANRLIDYQGETRTLAEWSRVTGIQHTTILLRLRLGWSVERSLSTTPVASPPMSITYDGMTMRLSEWAQRIGIPYETLRHRIKYSSLSIEEALRMPLQTQKNRSWPSNVRSESLPVPLDTGSQA